MPCHHAALLIRPALALLAAAALFIGPAAAQDERPDEPPDILLDWGVEQQPQRDRAGQDRAQPPREQARPDADRPTPTRPGEPMVAFDAFSEPVQLTTLIDFVGETLGLNIVVKGSPTGEIVFNAPMSIPQSRLLDLLDAMLEQYGFAITSEQTTGFYIVQPVTDIRPSLGGERSSVRIIATPNIKPSRIMDPLAAVLGASGGTGTQLQAVDELGVLIISGGTRDIARAESMIAELMRIDSELRYIRFELRNIAAPAALERAIGLVGGQAAAGPAFPGQQQIQIQQQMQRAQREQGQAQSVGISGGSFSNLADRITVDPQGNALIFRGTEAEIDRVRGVLAQIDVRNTLEPRNYFAGSSAAQIADMAKLRGLGEVVQVADPQAGMGQVGMDFGMQFQRGMQQAFGQPQGTQQSRGGPVMVVDPIRGSIIYYGTPEQHEQMTNLMKELRADDERIVIRSYILNHSDAEIVADLITGLITGQRMTGDAPLLPTARGTTRPGAAGTSRFILPFQDGTQPGDDVSASFDPDIVRIMPNAENNQVIVQAPVRQQDEIAKLIERLDRRRAQVYIQAMIVSVADDEDFALAFESQYLRGEFGIGTNFGLSVIGEDGAFTDPRRVNPGLAGLTSAIIRSDYVPLIVNASQTNSKVRIVSSPQLLVNDNEEAEIISVEEQPFSTTIVGQTTDQTSFGGFETAGTTLRVTPSISEGGFLRLDYFVELSNFTRSTGIGNSPPPRNTRTVTGKATIPSDATIVVGGLTVDDIRNTVAKVPFIGDIPLVGELFRSTNRVNNRARLYVFLTPRIMTDPNFNDLKLLTRGPQSEMGIDPDAPDLEAETIRSSLPRRPVDRSGAPELEPASLD
ncbi:MAG: hypothetical protein LAT64_12865 [Phycisphaerales bacterium]|nr:hypothetical protein [Planctomycetota bacterium]MCH8509646.1 hypothetical protein [Phycisphaerales bacterium]